VAQRQKLVMLRDPAEYIIKKVRTGASPSLRPVENYVKSLLYNDLVIDASQAVASSIIVERVG